MTPEQFEAFMTAQAQHTERLLAVAREGMAGAGGGAGAAAAVGQLQPCNLGKDKTKRFTNWSNWLKDAKTKMSYLGITSDTQKLAYMKSQAGAELLTLWEKEVRARWESVPANEERGIAALEAHNFSELVTETERVLLEIVDRDRAVIDMLQMKQGDLTVMEFLAKVEDQSKLTRADSEPITEEGLTRMTLIAGFKDRNLAEKVLAEKYSLKTTVELAVTRESSKANARAMQGMGEVEVRRLGRRSKSESDKETSIRDLQRQLDKLKARQHRKTKDREEESSEGGDRGGHGANHKCRNCGLPHPGGACRAANQTCYQCEGVGHFARAPACPEQDRRRRRQVNRLPNTTSSSTCSDSGNARRVTSRQPDAADRVWPGVAVGASGAPHRGLRLHRVQGRRRRSSTSSLPADTSGGSSSSSSSNNSSPDRAGTEETRYKATRTRPGSTMEDKDILDTSDDTTKQEKTTVKTSDNKQETKEDEGKKTNWTVVTRRRRSMFGKTKGEGPPPVAPRRPWWSRLTPWRSRGTSGGRDEEGGDAASARASAGQGAGGGKPVLTWADRVQGGLSTPRPAKVSARHTNAWTTRMQMPYNHKNF